MSTISSRNAFKEVFAAQLRRMIDIYDSQKFANEANEMAYDMLGVSIMSRYHDLHDLGAGEIANEIFVSHGFTAMRFQ